MFDLDWSALFVPSDSLVEIAIRGTIIYLALFLVMRILPRRTMGAMGPSDLLVVVLIADAVQNAMAGGYESITEGILLAVVIFGWATFIDWLDYRFPEWQIAQASALPVIINGKLVRANMKRQQITEDEVMAQLRQHGQDSLEAVRRAVLEGDGHFSVILRNREPVTPPARRDQA
jgi:uncharacterized membrane protein YcaP (DUF421 family)